MQHSSFEKWGGSHGEKTCRTRIHPGPHRIPGVPVYSPWSDGEYTGSCPCSDNCTPLFSLSISVDPIKEFPWSRYSPIHVAFLLRRRLVGRSWSSRPWRGRRFPCWLAVTYRWCRRAKADPPHHRVPRPQPEDPPHPAAVPRQAVQTGRSSTPTSWATR